MMSSPEVNALQDLRKGSLYAILSTILLSIAIVFLLASLAVISALLPFASSSSSAYLGSSFASIGSLAGVIVLEIIALIFTILSVLKLRSGFRGLEATGKDVGGVTGTTLWIIGVILAIIPLIDIIGAILIIIGVILIGLAIRRVGQIYNVGNIRNGGILIAIGSIIPFAAFIGFILTYIGLGKLLNTMGPGGQPPSGPSQGATPTQ
jgi:Protein of unknown function (DUF973).